MRFNPAAFDAHLLNMGQQVRWRRAYSCSCIDPASGAPDHLHVPCKGKGRIWADPVDTVVGIANQQVQLDWAKMGEFETGDMILSVPQISPLWDAGKFDRVTLLNSTSPFSMPLIHGDPTEVLPFVPSSISRVLWFLPNNTLVEGGIPMCDSTGHLTWLEGEPPPGMRYSITGTKNDEYFVFQHLMSDRNEHQGMRLPKRCVLRKWDLYGR